MRPRRQRHPRPHHHRVRARRLHRRHLRRPRAALAPRIRRAAMGRSPHDTTDIENFPGFPGGIGGVELMERHRDQAASFGADLRPEEADSIDLAGPVKTVLAGGVTYRSRAVILAMGAATRYLGIPGEQDLLGRGIKLLRDMRRLLLPRTEGRRRRRRRLSHGRGHLPHPLRKQRHRHPPLRLACAHRGSWSNAPNATRRSNGCWTPT